MSLDELQIYLGLGGMVPVVGEPLDAADGLISLARGDYTGASLSAASMFPFVGWGPASQKRVGWATRSER